MKKWYNSIVIKAKRGFANVHFSQRLSPRANNNFESGDLTMRKRLLSVFLCLCMIMTLMPISALAADNTKIASGTCGANSDNITWEITANTEPSDNLDGEKILTLRGTGDMESFNSYRDLAPWYSYRDSIVEVIIEDGITSISDYAFYKCSRLGTISLPNSIASIGDEAFSGSGLTSISIPQNVNQIGRGAFSDCENLTAVTISASDRLSSGDSIFEGSPIKNMVVDMATLPYNLLVGCDELTTIKITSNVLRIEENFSDCINLINIDVDDANPAFTSVDGALFNKEQTKLIRCLVGKSEFIIPSTVTMIGASAFADCTQLQTVSVPDSVIQIGSSAFLGCSNLNSVTLPSKLESLSYSLFRDCTSLTTVAIPETVSYIESRAFEGCSKLESITLPNGLTDIDSSAFEGCSKLESIALPNGLTDIGVELFLRCASLKTINIPDKINYIPPSTFEDCSSLETVRLPASIKRINAAAFKGCSNLQQVIFAGTKAQWDAISIADENEELTLKASILYGGQVPVNGYEITFDANGGIPTSSTINTNTDGKLASLPQPPTRKGYTFIGWFTSKGGGEQITTDIVFISNTTVYARWSKDSAPISPDSFTVSVAGGTASPTSAAAGTVVTLTATPRENELFNGWEISPAVTYESGYSAKSNPTRFVMPSHNVTAAAAVKTKLNMPAQVTGKDLQMTMEEGISEVPATLTAKFSTSSELKGALKERLPQSATVATYNVELLDSQGGPAAVNKYPSDGKLTVTLPYPDGTGKNTHDFSVAHMFTTSAFGKTPGNIETPAVTKTSSGVQFTVTGLSPIALGWTQVQSSSSGNAGSSGSSGSSSGSSSSGGSNSSSNSSSSNKTETTYKISASDDGNGSVKLGSKEAAKGDTVKITVKPDDGYELDELFVTDKKGNDVRIKEKSDNKYAFTMPSSKVNVEATFAEIEKEPERNESSAPVQFAPTAVASAPASAAPVFADVPATNQYYNAVRFVQEKGIMTGTSATQFSPDTTISRGMIVSILHRLEGQPISQGASFNDVSDTGWYTNAVAWASSNKIVSGYSNGNFGPNDTITREQLISILYRYAQYKMYDTASHTDLSNYTDASEVAPYAAAPMQWAITKILITSTNSALSPTSDINRAQAADILMRFCQNVAM